MRTCQSTLWQDYAAPIRTCVLNKERSRTRTHVASISSASNFPISRACSHSSSKHPNPLHVAAEKVIISRLVFSFASRADSHVSTTDPKPNQLPLVPPPPPPPSPLESQHLFTPQIIVPPTKFLDSPSYFPSLTINFSGGAAGSMITSSAPSGLCLPYATTSPSDHVSCDMPSASLSAQPAQPAVSRNATDVLMAAKQLKWTALLEQFGATHVNNHDWDWEDGDFLPRYEYQSVSRITDIWVEWASGLNGFIPVRDLTEKWGPKWRRNLPRKKTESARRKAVVDLINELVKKTRWEVPLALRYLQERYEPLYKPRPFCEYLTKDNRAGFQAVLLAAQSFP